MMEWKKSPAKVAILGGDQRMVHTADAFIRDGNPITLWGQDASASSAVQEAVRDADWIVLPIPLTRDGVHLNAPLIADPPTLDTICNSLCRGQIVAAGAVPAHFANAVNARGCRMIDYQTDEGFAIQNAHATAEGAIAIALSESPELLADAPTAVLGFGRIGKQLVRLLLAMGANVTLYARKKSDLAYGETIGCRALPLTDAPKTLAQAKLIFNTIPVRLFELDRMDLPPNRIIIDLAPIYPPMQTPRLIRATALPANYSPKSAGKFIHDAVADAITTLAGEEDCT